MKVHYKIYHFTSKIFFTTNLTLHSWIGILKIQVTFYFNFISFRSLTIQHYKFSMFQHLLLCPAIRLWQISVIHGIHSTYVKCIIQLRRLTEYLPVRLFKPTQIMCPYLWFMELVVFWRSAVCRLLTAILVSLSNKLKHSRELNWLLCLVFSLWDQTSDLWKTESRK